MMVEKRTQPFYFMSLCVWLCAANEPVGPTAAEPDSIQCCCVQQRWCLPHFRLRHRWALD